MKKVFIIGFNKTATSALDYIFKKSGYKTQHNDFGNLAVEIDKCVKEGNLPLGKYKNFDVFSDMIHSTPNEYLEANKYFKELDQAYPGSYFILNIRNEDDWIKSRFRHEFKGRRFVTEAMQSLNKSTELDLEIYWRQLRQQTHSNIINYFKNKDNFLLFDCDNDNISKLIKFVKNDYNLDVNQWQRINVTKG